MMEAAAEKSARFWDRKAEAYAKQAIPDPDAYQKKLALTREYMTPDSSVLEFGCGTGSTALIHAAHVKNIVAIDISRKMIEIARQKAKKSGVENVGFIQATLDELTFEPGSFDIVLGLNVLYLLDDMDAAIQKSFELLSPGGVFISSTACIARANHLVQLLLPVGAKLGLIPRVKIFDIAALEASITRAGFRIVKSAFLNRNGMTCFLIAQKQ